LPQLKLGWIVVFGPARLRAEAMRRLEFVADAYLSVGSPVQHAAPDLFATREGIQHQIRRRLDENEHRLVEAIGGALRPREGGWSAIIDVPDRHSDEQLALELLEREGILVHPGYFYDFVGEEVMVLSLLPSPEIFAEAVSRLTRGLDRV
jgi:aspartate/methionine/tyrosine aminotransferase